MTPEGEKAEEADSRLVKLANINARKELEVLRKKVKELLDIRNKLEKRLELKAETNVMLRAEIEKHKIRVDKELEEEIRNKEKLLATGEIAKEEAPAVAEKVTEAVKEVPKLGLLEKFKQMAHGQS